MNVYAHPWAALLWLLVIAGELLLAFIALVQRSARPQRFFGALALTLGVRGALLFAASLAGAVDFYYDVYWGTLYLCFAMTAAQAGLCYKDLFYPPDSMPRRFHRQFALLTVALTALVILSHVYVRYAQHYAGAESRMLIYRSCVLWLCGFYWIVTGLAQHWCLRLHSRAFGVAAGMMFNLTTSLVMGAAFSSIHPFDIPSLYFVQMAAELGTVVLWLRYFLRVEAPVYARSRNPWRRWREAMILSIWGELGGSRAASSRLGDEREKCRADR